MLGIGFGSGIDAQKRMLGKLAVGRSRLAADSNLKELREVRRTLRRKKREMAQMTVDAERARQRGEHEASHMLIDIKRRAILQSRQEEQLIKLAELTAVHKPALIRAAIAAVREGDADAVGRLVAEGVGSREDELKRKRESRQQAELEEAQRVVLADKWGKHILSAAAGMSQTELTYQAQLKEQASKEALQSVRSQLGKLLRDSHAASATLEGMFRDMDESGDGGIDRAEFSQGLESLGILLPAEELEAVLDLLDGDGEWRTALFFMRFIALPLVFLR